MIRNQRNSYQLKLHKFLRMKISVVLISLLPSRLLTLIKKFALRDVPEPDIDEKELFEIIDKIRNLHLESILNQKILEDFLIHSIGLNNESLHQQPTELENFYGKGLHLWQYPNQLASLLTTEFENLSSVDRYIEIGSRWCGTFILMSEFIYLANPNLKEIIAVDIIQEPKTLSMYRKYISENGGPELTYSFLGTSYLKNATYNKTEKTLCFIDGDHSLQAVMRDHQIVLDFADLIIHHDINSDATPQVRDFWDFIKTLQNSEWNFRSYTDQYPSVRGNFLGIGFMVKKNREKGLR
jgi:hypothetical protein